MDKEGAKEGEKINLPQSFRLWLTSQIQSISTSTPNHQWLTF